MCPSKERRKEVQVATMKITSTMILTTCTRTLIKKMVDMVMAIMDTMTVVMMLATAVVVMLVAAEAAMVAVMVVVMAAAVTEHLKVQKQWLTHV